MSADSESETDLNSMAESSPEQKVQGGPFSFEPMITDSENLTK